MRTLLNEQRIHGRITLSGYEGSELLVARLLIDCGADVRYVGSACPSTPWNAHDAEWLRARGVQVQFRATLEQDLQAMHEHGPDLVIGTTPVVQRAKEMRLPALYFTNLISARPLLGVPGMSSLVDVVRAAMANRERMDQMHGFFDGVTT
jgi:chlorophyllide a reductase subunit Y